MAAGVGSRLDPLTRSVPKPLVPVCNIPIMEYNIELLRDAGITDIVANLYSHPQMIIDRFEDGAKYGVKILYSLEKELLGTAGGVKKMADMISFAGDTFVVISSDVLMNIDLKALIKFHQNSKALATVALIEVEDPSQYGVVITDSAGRITFFQEKPEKGTALSRFANTGVYVFDKKILEMIPGNSFFDFGKQLFPRLAKLNEAFYGFGTKSYWLDIGALENYKKANFDVQNGVLGKDKTSNVSSGAITGKNCTVSKTSSISKNVIMGNNCVIEDGATIISSILWDNVLIGKNVLIDSCIIGSGCTVAGNALVPKGSVLASGTNIG